MNDDQQPEDNLNVVITTRDFDWLADHVAVSEDLAAALDEAVTDEERVTLTLNADDLDELLNSLADLEDESSDAELLATCRALTEKIEGQIPEGFYWPDGFEGDEEAGGDEEEQALLATLLMANLPEEIREQMGAIVEAHADNPPTDEEMTAQMAPTMEKFRGVPLDLYHGLTLGQFMGLLEAEWSTEASPLQTASDIDAADLAHLELLHNARALLDAVAGGRIALDDGYMDDDSMRALVPQLRLGDPEVIAEMLAEPDFDSGDLIEVEQLRSVCEAAGLLETSEDDTALTITELGQTLRAPEAAGGLLEALFLAQFQHCALDWSDPEDAWPSLHLGMPFSLYVLSQTGPEGVSLDHFSEAGLLPSATIDQPEPLMRGESPENLRLALTHCRIIDPLAAYGLVDVEYIGNPDSPERVDLRKTALFDQLIRFEFPEA